MLCLSFRQLQTIEQHQLLNLEQKMELKKYEKELREIVNGPAINLKLKGYDVCPKCDSSRMSVLSGALLSCDSCKHVFNHATKKVVKRIVFTVIGESETLIETSHLNELEIKKRILELPVFISPLTLYNQDPTLYANIKLSYGSIEKAFTSVGIIYANPALEHWQTTIVEYLGVLTDLQISAIIGKTHQTVNYYRNRLGIESASSNWAQVKISDEEVEKIRNENKEKLKYFIQDNEKKTNAVDFRRRAKDFIRSVREQGLTDEKIRRLLLAEGIKIARRTVSKYKQDCIEEDSLLEKSMLLVSVPPMIG